MDEEVIVQQQGDGADDVIEAPRQKSPREAMMEVVTARRHEELRANGVTIERPLPEDLEPPTSEDDQDDGQDNDRPDPQPDAQADPQPGRRDEAKAARQAEDDDLVEVKIDGETRTVKVAELRRIHQKESAADARLRKAAEMEAALNARAAQLEEAERAIKARAPSVKDAQQADEVQPSVKDAGRIREMAAEAVAGFYSGDEEQALEKFEAALSNVARLGSTLDASQVQQIVYEQMEEQERRRQETAALRDQEAFEKARQEAVERFKTDFDDLAADANLTQVADSMTQTLRAENPDWDPWKIIETAGKETRKWARSRGFAGIKSDITETRREDKRTLQAHRVAPATARQAQAPDYVPATRSQVVQRMKKARGQA